MHKLELYLGVPGDRLYIQNLSLSPLQIICYTGEAIVTLSPNEGGKFIRIASQNNISSLWIFSPDTF